ncbi:MAG: M48 family metallopeptidase [Comamonas sp.]|nr:M48 family metallopeptidase [Comamonas sp.]
MSNPSLPYLQAYPLHLQAQVLALLQKPNGVSNWLLERYAQPHHVRSDKALYAYVGELKSEHLRKAGGLHSVAYDNKIHVVRNALGLHTRRSVVQGGRLNAKHEIRIASMFKFVPEAFLRMIVVHELAHLREVEHDKAFYALCCHMEPNYHQFELEVRIYLSHLEAGGARLWHNA